MFDSIFFKKKKKKKKNTDFGQYWKLLKLTRLDPEINIFNLIKSYQ